MGKNYKFAGVAGFVFLLFGGLFDYHLEDAHGYLVYVHYALGAVFLLPFLIEGARTLSSSYTAKRKAGFGIGMLLYSLVFAGLLIVANVISARHEFFHFDSTEQKVFTLAPQTRKILSTLEQNLYLRGFYLAGRVDTETEDLMKRITRESDKVSWEVLDPEKEPVLVEKYGISEPSTIHVSFEGDSEERSVKLVRDTGEEDFVNAILKLTRGGAKKIYYVTGHGEPSLVSDEGEGYLFLGEAVEGENLIVEELPLPQSKAIPSDASAVVLAAPEKLLFDEEKKAISDYLNQGGRMIMLHEPRRTTDIKEIAAKFGIVVGDDLVIDQSWPGQETQPVVMSYAAHPITQAIDQGTWFSLVSSVQAIGAREEGEIAIELGRTSHKSWAETDVARIFDGDGAVGFDEKDLKGPVPVAVALQKPVKKEGDDKAKLRLVVFGDADFVTNVYLRQLYNRDLFLNALNWVVGEEQSVALRARSLRESTKRISPAQFNVLFLTTALLFPELFLIGGILIWWTRSRGAERSKDER